MKQVEETRSKTVATGQRMDLVFYTLRMGFFDLDFELIAKNTRERKEVPLAVLTCQGDRLSPCAPTSAWVH